MICIYLVIPYLGEIFFRLPPNGPSVARPSHPVVDGARFFSRHERENHAGLGGLRADQLHQYPSHHRAMHIGEPPVQSAVADGQALVVNAHEV